MKHPHADLIKQMVDDDTLRATATDATGECRLDTVACYPNYDWRLVPPKPKTITIVAGGKTYELPEPMRVAPEVGAKYYLFWTLSVDEGVWRNADYDQKWLSLGLLHATPGAAQQWVDAMAEIRGAK